MSAPSQAVTIRAAEPADAARAGRICFEAFKCIADEHGFPPDFPSPDIAGELLGAFISNPHVYGVVAEEGGTVVGSNFLWGATVGGIGPITIAPDRQNAGIGRRLMDAVLERAQAEGMVSVRLVQAGYHMRSLALYASMGFACREHLVVMQGTPFLHQVSGHSVRMANAADADAATALCERVHGHGRRTEFLDGVSQGTARVVEFDGRLVAYTAGLAFFGHSVAETNDGLKALIGSGEPIAGPGILLPSRNQEVFRWALAKGLRAVQPMTLMTTGFYGEPQGAYLPSVLY